MNACFLHSLSLAGPNRVLRIVVNTRRKPRDIIASIAHELSHAMEVLSEPGIRDDLGIFNFYNREGVKRGEAFETLEAIQTEMQVRSEVGRDFDKSAGIWRNDRTALTRSAFFVGLRKRDGRLRGRRSGFARLGDARQSLVVVA